MPWRFYTSGAQPYTIGSSPVNPASKRQITLRALGQGISRVSLPCRAQTLPPYREGIVSLLPPSSTRARMALRGRNRQRVGSPGGSGSCRRNRGTLGGMEPPLDGRSPPPAQQVPNGSTQAAKAASTAASPAPRCPAQQRGRRRDALLDNQRPLCNSLSHLAQRTIRC